MSRTVLIVDDEQSIRQSLRGVLQDEGYHVFEADSGKSALEVARANSPEVILLDIWMPELDGIETLKILREQMPDQTVIMMSGHGTIDTAVRATKLGAFDFIEKPLSLEKLLLTLQNAFVVVELATENQALRKQVSKQRTLIGHSPALTELREMIKQVAPTTGSVLITGENGTGKELVAHSVHSLSPRFNKPFVEVNCAAIPEELIESELFGHEKGAFTGAIQLRRGKFDLAHTGTLFLDEIADMSLKTQAKILRILQEQKFERVGGTQTISVDVRIIAATNKDLKAEIKSGHFREDLYYRLNVVPFHVPALRDRREDIPLLVDYFLKEFCQAHAKPLRKASKDALRILIEYPWPGNIRELKNLIERTIILTTEHSSGKEILAADLFQYLSSEFNPVSDQSLPATSLEIPHLGRNLRDARQEFEKEFILRTLTENDWNISKTASELGVERSHLHKKIKAFGIEPPSDS